MVDENNLRVEQYRLERLDGAFATVIAVFPTRAEATTVLSHLNPAYRVMHGDQEVLVAGASSSRHGDKAR